VGNRELTSVASRILPHAHGGQDFSGLLTCFVDFEFIDVAQRDAALPVADRILDDEDLPSAQASPHAKTGKSSSKTMISVLGGTGAMARTVSGVSFIVDLDAVLATPDMRSLTQLIDFRNFQVVAKL
jgi:hypothetical protein